MPSLVDQALGEQDTSFVSQGLNGAIPSLVSQADNTGSLVDQALGGDVGLAKEFQSDRQNLLESGFSMAKGQFWKGLGTALDVGGLTEESNTVLKWSEENINDATQTPPENFGEKLIFATGQLGVPIGAMATAALAAPFIGLSSAVGAGAAGLMASWGMTVGDFIGKEEALDPEYDADFSDLAIGTALTAPDLIPITRGIKLLTPLGKSVSRVAVDTAEKSGGFIREVGTTALQTGAGEGIQDFAGSLAASVTTGTGLDENKIASYGFAAAEEAAIGAILGGALGGITNTFADSTSQAAFDADYEAQHPTLIQDEEGNLSADFRNLELVEGAPKQPGFAKIAFNVLLGNSTDKLKTKLANMPKAQALLQRFNLRPNERGPGKFTINDQARTLEGELLDASKDFNSMSKGDKEAAWNAKAEGALDMSIPGHAALHDVLNVRIPAIYDTASRGKAKTESGLFKEDTYLPTFKAQDWKKMSTDEQIIAKAEADLVAQGKTEEETAAAMKSLREQIKSYETHGDHLTLSRDRKTSRFQNSLFVLLEDSIGEKISKKKRAGMKKNLRTESKKDQKSSPLTLERSLRHFSQSFLNNYRRKDVDASGLLDQHIRMVTEHAALIDNFGMNGEIFDDAVFDIAVDAHNAGQTIDAGDIDGMYDVYRTQQRIHLRPIKSNRVRKAQQFTRAALNTTLLGLSVLVSIPESLVIFMNTGGKAGLQALVQTMLNGVNLKNAGLASERLGYSLRTAMGHAINRTGEESYEVGTWENSFMKWTGLPYLQHFMTVWAARANDIYVKDMITDLNSGKLRGGEANFITRKLNQAGIDVEQAKAWADRGFSEQDAYFSEQYLPAIIGLTQDTIVDPAPIDKPLWMNDEHLLLLTQLKGFMTVFTNRVMRGWKDKVIQSGPEGNRALATKVAPYVAMYIAAQVAMQAVREVIKSGNLEDWDEKTTTDRVMSAFGYLGGMSYFIDTINSFRFRSDPLASAAGPAVSKALKTGSITVNSIEAMDADAFMDDMLKAWFPNVPAKDLILEALGAE